MGNEPRASPRTEEKIDFAPPAPVALPNHQAGYTIKRRDRNWEVLDPKGELVCLTVYKCGAEEVVRRLSPREQES